MDNLEKHEQTTVHAENGAVNEKGHDLDVYPSHVDSYASRRGSMQDAVFGEITEEGPNYRNVVSQTSNGCHMGTNVVFLGPYSFLIRIWNNADLEAHRYRDGLALWH